MARRKDELLPESSPHSSPVSPAEAKRKLFGEQEDMPAEQVETPGLASYTAPTIVTSGASFAQFQLSGLSGLLELLIAAQPASANPSGAPTLAASGTTATLPAGTYYAVFTEINGIGETKPSPASSGQVVTAGQGITVTFPALQTGNVARNLYLGTAAAGPFSLYAPSIIAGTFSCLLPLPPGAAPPAVNSTALGFSAGGSLNIPLSMLRGAKGTFLEDAYKFAAQVARDFLQGEPASIGAVEVKLRHAAVVFGSLSQLMTDAATLVDANQGSFHNVVTGIG